MAATIVNLTAVVFILSLLSAASAAAADLHPSHRALSAAGNLRSRGYSLVASILESTSRSGKSLNGFNFTGTLFAPSDAAFKNRRRIGLRLIGPSTYLLLYHAARSPPLALSDLMIRPAGSAIRTFSPRRRCIFLHRSPSGNLCLSEYALRKIRDPHCVRIRDPNLHLDGDFAVHGIDGVLDPFAASACRLDTWQRVRRPDLDGVLTALRANGYGAVAEAMEARRSDLEKLTAVTILAVKDSNGNHPYDLDRHLIPRRCRLRDLARVSRIETMARDATVAVGSDADGAVTVNGVAVAGEEVYSDWWAVLLPIQRPLVFDGESDESSVNGDGETPPQSSLANSVTLDGVDVSLLADSGGSNVGTEF